MLTHESGWTRIAEVNPPEMPEARHHDLFPAWSHVLVTDNVFANSPEDGIEIRGGGRFEDEQRGIKSVCLLPACWV